MTTKSPPPARGVSPTSAEVEAHLLRLCVKHPRLAQVRELARTEGDRPISAITITDPTVRDELKQNALIVAGQHGDEESGRMVALGLADWLVSKAGAETRRKQKIVIIPNVNPDGADADTHLTPGGVRPNADHGPGGATSPEGKAVEIVAHELQPELFVDLHARGGAGCSYDMVLFPKPREYEEDGTLLHNIAAEMVRAGERTGIPHITHPLTWSGWGGEKGDEPSTTVFAYRNFKSMVFLTENCESNPHAYPAAQRLRSGLARMKVLLAHGNGRDPHFYYEGYPVNLIGMHSGGFVAWGRTAAERRRSRVAIWTHLDAIEMGVRAVNPEEARSKALRFAYRGPALTTGAGAQFRTGGRMAVASVSLDGRPLRRSETDGYYTWQDVCSTYVVAAMPVMEPGEHEIWIRFR